MRKRWWGCECARRAVCLVPAPSPRELGLADARTFFAAVTCVVPEATHARARVRERYADGTERASGCLKLTRAWRRRVVAFNTVYTSRLSFKALRCTARCPFAARAGRTRDSGVARKRLYDLVGRRAADPKGPNALEGMPTAHPS